MVLTVWAAGCGKRGESQEAADVDNLNYATSTYLLAVPELVEFDLERAPALPRQKLRALCDREKTREGILAAWPLVPKENPRAQ